MIQNDFRSSDRVKEVNTLFISLLVLCGYYSRKATIRGRLLFEGGVCFYGKPGPQRHQRRLDKVRTSEMVTVARHCQ